MAVSGSVRYTVGIVALNIISLVLFHRDENNSVSKLFAIKCV